jgi:phytoene synthase
VIPADIPPDDLAACRAAIRQGSRSFHAASLLLPARVRDPALALYAFCRLADDAVDEAADRRGGTRAVAALHDRLGRVYAGRPRNAPADRAFAAVVATHDLPRTLPEALLEGFAWDAAGRRYDTLPDLTAYCVRVAGTVGAMMTVLMGVRDRDALARACDLGVAMQLTNIARDVGEDAAAGRLYLPRDWLRGAGIDPEDFLAAPRPTPNLVGLVRRLLDQASALYVRGETGVSVLPADCRPGILAARHIYAAIGRRVEASGERLLDRRARTSGGEKLALTGLALARAVGYAIMPGSAFLHAPALPEAAFLVEAAMVRDPGSTDWGDGRAGMVMAIFAQLEAQDRGRGQGLAV